MRAPAGAPTSGWLRLKQRHPLLARLKFRRPPLGTLAVWGLVGGTSIAAFFMFAWPHLYRDYYKQQQAQKRALLHADRETLAQGMRPWSDPFDRDTKASTSSK